MEASFILNGPQINNPARFARFCEVCLGQYVRVGSAKSHDEAETNLATPRKPRTAENDGRALLTARTRCAGKGGKSPRFSASDLNPTLARHSLQERGDGMQTTEKSL